MTPIKEVMERIDDTIIKIESAQSGLLDILKNYEDDEVKEILKNYSGKGIYCILDEALSLLDDAFEKLEKLEDK